MAQQHDEMESKFQSEIADLKPKEEELKVSYFKLKTWGFCDLALVKTNLIYTQI